MTPDEIQALRKKHRPVMQLKRPNGNNCCSCGTFDGYPCDTIKVLDALHEQWRLTNLAYGEGHNDGYGKGLASAYAKNQACRHVAYRLVLTWRGREWVTNEFCPKCGAILQSTSTKGDK